MRFLIQEGEKGSLIIMRSRRQQDEGIAVWGLFCCYLELQKQCLRQKIRHHLDKGQDRQAVTIHGSKDTALGRLKLTLLLQMWSTSFKQSINMVRMIRAISHGSCAGQRGKVSGALTAVSFAGIATERWLSRTSLKGCWNQNITCTFVSPLFPQHMASILL